jgi:hypothetical protein
MDQKRNDQVRVPRDPHPVEEYRDTDASQGGISNRGLDREINEQAEVPPRGETKAEEADNE